MDEMVCRINTGLHSGDRQGKWSDWEATHIQGWCNFRASSGERSWKKMTLWTSRLLVKQPGICSSWTKSSVVCVGKSSKHFGSKCLCLYNILSSCVRKRKPVFFGRMEAGKRNRVPILSRSRKQRGFSLSKHPASLFSASLLSSLHLCPLPSGLGLRPIRHLGHSQRMGRIAGPSRPRRGGMAGKQCTGTAQVTCTSNML